jgi:hypothetical protein
MHAPPKGLKHPDSDRTTLGILRGLRREARRESGRWKDLLVLGSEDWRSNFYFDCFA